VGYRFRPVPDLEGLEGKPRFEKESMMKYDSTMMDTERRIAVTAHREDGEDDAEGAKGRRSGAGDDGDGEATKGRRRS
jgi:hypothetical protein